MSDPKRHHYIPRFYLEKFSKEGRLWVYDRIRNQYRLQNSINIALENQFYTVVEADGSKNTEIEKFLAVIEGDTKPIIEKIEQEQKLSDKETEVLATFVSFLKVRTPDFEKTINESSEKMLKKVNQMMFSSEKRAEELIKRYKDSTGDKMNISAKDMVDFIRRDEYTMNFGREQFLLMVLELGREAVDYFLNMNWSFLKAPDNTSFITSDKPFVLLPPDNFDHKSYYGFGILTPGTTKIIPLSGRVCLMMGDQGQKVANGFLSREQVRRINLAIAYHCDQLLIGRDRDLLERLVNTTKIDKWNITSRVQVG